MASELWCFAPAAIPVSIIIAILLANILRWLASTPQQRALRQIDRLERKQRKLRIKFLSNDD